MVDESTLRRLLAGEAHRMNESVVMDGVALHSLLRQSEPAAVTKSGKPHPFDLESLERFAAPLSPLLRATLEVPVRFVIDHRVPGSACVTETAVRDALLAHGVHVGAFASGRAWLSLPRAQSFARSYPTLVQFLRL